MIHLFQSSEVINAVCQCMLERLECENYVHSGLQVLCYDSFLDGHCVLSFTRVCLAILFFSGA
jgi:hypothetical protein